MNRPKPKKLIITQNRNMKHILEIYVGTAEAEKFIRAKICIEEFGTFKKESGGYSLIVKPNYDPEEVREFLLSSFHTEDKMTEETIDELFTK